MKHIELTTQDKAIVFANGSRALMADYDRRDSARYNATIAQRRGLSTIGQLLGEQCVSRTNQQMVAA